MKKRKIQDDGGNGVKKGKAKEEGGSGVTKGKGQDESASVVKEGKGKQKLRIKLRNKSEMILNKKLPKRCKEKMEKVILQPHQWS